MGDIATSYISKLRMFLCPDGVVGSSNRWWSGKKDFDFLQIEESSSSQAGKSFESRMERLLDELCTPNSCVERAPSDVEAVQRGLNFLMQVATDDHNFKLFGSEIFQTFYEVATSAEEPLRRFSLLRTEVAAQIWQRHNPSLHRADNSESSSPAAILDFIRGMGTLERVGISHDCKEEVRIAASCCSPADFFGENASALTSPPLEATPPLSCREYSLALSHCYWAAKVGVDIHLRLATVLSLLPFYRPHTFEEKEQQQRGNAVEERLGMLCTVVQVLSNHGELRLSPTLLPHEYAYLSNPVHVHRSIQSGDVVLLGRLCHSLIVLGHREEGALGEGLAFLRHKQLLGDGSWPSCDAQDASCSSRCHATMCAIAALKPRRFRGYGPSDPLLLVQLQGETHATGTTTPSFMDAPLHTLSSFRVLNGLYGLSADCAAQETDMSAQMYGTSRVQDILRTTKKRKQCDELNSKTIESLEAVM